VDLQVKARAILGGLAELPMQRGEVIRIDEDGSVFIRFGKTLLVAKANTIMPGKPVRKGQYVNFLEDPVSRSVCLVMA
jgi:hypothetical protein